MLSSLIMKNVFRKIHRNKLHLRGFTGLVNPRALNKNRCFCEKNARISNNSLILCRKFGENNSTEDPVPLLPLFEEPIAMNPSILYSIANYITTKLLIKPFIDNTFDVSEFITAAIKASTIVSKALSEEDYESVEGLVVQDLVQRLKVKISALTPQQRELLSLEGKSLFISHPYHINVNYNPSDENQRIYVDILVVHHYFCGEMPKFTYLHLLPNAEKSKYVVCNYRYTREYTPGVEDYWKINYINYMKPKSVYEDLEQGIGNFAYSLFTLHEDNVILLMQTSKCTQHRSDQVENNDIRGNVIMITFIISSLFILKGMYRNYTNQLKNPTLTVASGNK